MCKYKLKNTKNWLTIEKISYRLGTLVFSVWVSPFSAGEQLLSEWQAKILEQQQNQYFQDNKVDTSLFQTNLKNHNLQTIASQFNTLTSIQASLQSDYANCYLTKPEISTILIFSNENFKFKFLNALIQKGKNENDLPESKHYQKACEQLSKCVLGFKSEVSISLTECNNIIGSHYEAALQSHKENQQIKTANLSANKYQNGDKKDSDFDLLHDISQIGKIMFEGFKSQPEIIFYQTPNFEGSEKIQENWLSPQILPTLESNTNTSSGSTQHKDSTKTSTGSTTPTNTQFPNSQQQTTQNPSRQTSNWNTTTSSNLTEDEEINRFIANAILPSLQNNTTQHLFQNQCLPPGNTLVSPPTNPQTQTATFNPFSPDIANQNNTTLQSNLEKIRLPKAGNLPIQNTSWTTNSTNNNDIPTTQTPDAIDAQKEELQSCVVKCENKGLDFDEVQICKLTCLCGEYISPALFEIWLDIEKMDFSAPLVDTGALIIRFCTIPSKPIQVNTSSKTIYSISELIDEIQEVVASMEGNGKLTVHQKKTEALSTNKVAFDFKNSTSFTTQISQKASTSSISEKEQEAENWQFLSVITQATKEVERNSFVLMGNHSQQQANKSIKDPSLTEPPSLTSPETVNILINEILPITNMWETNSNLATFLDNNINFRKSTTEKLNTTEDLLKTLSQKKQQDK